MKYLSVNRYLRIWSELILSLVLIVVYFTNWDDAAFQNSFFTNIVRLLGILGLSFCIVWRIKDLIGVRGTPFSWKLYTGAYALLLGLLLFSCLFDPLFIKVRIYFATHDKEFEQLVKTANEQGCVPSQGTYCTGTVKVPFELLYWTGQDEMFVIKDAGKLYIMLGQKNTDGFVYMSNQDQIPSYIGIAYYDVGCYAKIADKWFICNVSI
jgi:hypothetical protein